MRSSDEKKCPRRKQLTRDENNWDEPRRNEKRWEDMRWGHMKFVFNCTCIDAAVKRLMWHHGGVLWGGTLVTMLTGERIRCYGGANTLLILMLRIKNIPGNFNIFFLLLFFSRRPFSAWVSQVPQNLIWGVGWLFYTGESPDVQKSKAENLSG